MTGSSKTTNNDDFDSAGGIDFQAFQELNFKWLLYKLYIENVNREHSYCLKLI
jgi:hypothetical protein